MTETFEEKIVLVTGGTSGIGEAAARAYAEAGARVALAGRRADRGEAVADAINKAGGDVVFIQTDITDTEQVKAMVAKTVERFGGLDIAFNNAGIGGLLVPLNEQTDANFDAVFDTNVRGVMNSMKFEIPAMLERGGGAIVNTSSVAGSIGMETESVYSASKHAVLGLTRSAALEFAAKGIRINAVCPGVIATDMYTQYIRKYPETKDYLDGLHPIGRVGTAIEVANLVLWLSSGAAGFMVGQAIPVDGGFTSQ